MNQPVTRSLEDIVDDIVRELGDARGQHLQRSEDDTRAAVLLGIRNWTEFRAHWDQWLSREGQTSMAEHAQKLGDVVTTLEQMIRDLPEPFAAYLFMPLRARCSITPAEEANAAATADHDSFLHRLERLRLDCADQKAPPGSSGPERDRVKVGCATFARNLMLAFSRRRVTGTAEGAYRVITSLLFEALTGEGDVDLKRACDRVLNDVRLGLSVT
jgi:hypothetical protein